MSEAQADHASARWSWRRVTGAALLLGLAALLLHQLSLLIMVVWLSIHDPSSSAFMRATLRQLRTEQPDAVLRHQWVPYDHISDHVKRAVVASEDADFVEHGGVEWDAIRRAWDYNRRQADQGSTARRGGSTITQQLAKNMFLSSSRSYLRKAQELTLTYAIETVMSKQRILELYLNVAQWGPDVFGIQAAAQHHFKRDASQLTARQAARLAVMLPSPTRYEAGQTTPYLNRRTDTILRRMPAAVIPD